MKSKKSLTDFFDVNIIADLLTTKNSLRIPSGNLGIPRSSMPQLDDFQGFVDILRDRFDIGVETRRLRIGDIKLAQGEVNKDKVFKMMVEYRIKNKRTRGGINFGGFPPVVTRDGFIFDGLHRQVAMYNINRHAYHNYTVIDADFRDLYRIVREHPSLFSRVVSFKRL